MLRYVAVFRNYAHFDGVLKCDDETSEVQGVHDKIHASPYIITAPLEADKELTDWIERRLKEQGMPVKRGLNCSAETFYACQVRSFLFSCSGPDVPCAMEGKCGRSW